MLAYASGRLVQTALVLVLISFIGFLLVANLGDPLASLLPVDDAVLTGLAAEIAAADAAWRAPHG